MFISEMTLLLCNPKIGKGYKRLTSCPSMLSALLFHLVGFKALLWYNASSLSLHCARLLLRIMLFCLVFDAVSLLWRNILDLVMILWAEKSLISFPVHPVVILLAFCRCSFNTPHTTLNIPFYCFYLN